MAQADRVTLNNSAVHPQCKQIYFAILGYILHLFAQSFADWFGIPWFRRFTSQYNNNNKYSIYLRHISSNKTIQRRITLYMNIQIT